ncbi:hypothetical protein Tco_0930150 [Tanacetum coccineum]
MSRSEPEEMALERSFSFRWDLRPRLPPSDLTMNKLLNDVIGIYIEQLDQGRMGIPFSTFLLVVISLKGWKKKFFLIDKRAIPKAMMWRHIDTDNLPDWNGTLVSKGNPIPDNERPPVRTITPLAVGSVIHDKNARQKSVEKPDQKIAEAREKKEKKTLFKANASESWLRGVQVSCEKGTGGARKERCGPIGSESEGTVFSIVLAYLISLLYLVNMM